MDTREEIISIREFSRRSEIPFNTVARWVKIGVIKTGSRRTVGIPASELKNLPQRKDIRALIKSKRKTTKKK